ncbi:hypothetical protein OG883_16330 [Streptomyces sp. NBC_01142]|uniref:hypothetical protein n=1 Tax=Streptomyces sp. NBC_01142 TaxID=2975865 RepID=UPI00224EA03C|nr:hypothetical protein [Streptomyces sp. NBC_01142]MCX4821442.1 hypothetical protein [Streptomyces sp. NBC_01142]
MPIPVHALAHRPLTAAAVAELVALPAVPQVPDDVDAMDAELQQRGWSWDHELVCDSFRTGYGHVLCSDGGNPFGHPDARRFLVFGELYPLDPDDESMTNGPWLYDLMDDWQQLPGWSGRRPCTDQDCEAVLAQAAQAVTEHLGTAPERTILSSVAVVTGPALTHRIWRTPTHALVLGPAADNGPYGFLTHLQLSCTPLACGPRLPPADDEDGLVRWVTAHVDW